MLAKQSAPGYPACRQCGERSRLGRSLHPYHDRSERTKMKMRSNPGTEVFAQTASSPDEGAADTKGVVPSQSLSARNRRRFLKGGMFAVGPTAFGAGVAPRRLLASQDDDRAPITKGDIAILRFLQAFETIEA